VATPEHLEILKQGAEVWNAWRRDNREVKPMPIHRQQQEVSEND
jgi:hypothetical protein